MRTNAALAVALVVLWSSGFVGAELGTRFASAHTLLAWRYVVAVAVLVPIVIVKGLRTDRAGFLRQCVLGLAVVCIYLGFTVSGVQSGVSAGISALIASLQPLLVASVAGPLLGERTDLRQRVGLVVGILGVVVVVVGDLSVASAPWWSYLLPFFGMVSLTVGTVYEKRSRPKEPIVLSLAIQCAVGAVFFLTWGTMAGDVVPPMTVDFWLAVTWVVVLSTFGGLGVYLFVVRRHGATYASTLLYLTPPTTMVWAWLMFGDPITTSAVGGLVVCAVGVLLVIGRRVRTSASDTADLDEGAVEFVERHEVMR